MRLLEINQIRDICASVPLDEATAAQVDPYAAFIQASSDDVVDTTLKYVFSKGRDFQEFLKTPQAKQAASTQRVQKTGNNGASEPAWNEGCCWSGIDASLCAVKA